MPRFAANLHYLFTELPFMQRFAAAASAGFKAVEFQVPYDYDGAELRAALRENDLVMALFDAPMGNWQGGDRGMCAIPGRQEEFRMSLPLAARYAQALGCDLVHVMAGVVPAGVSLEEAEQVYVDNLRDAARFFATIGVRVVIEPINKLLGLAESAPSYTTQGMQGYFLNHTRQALQIVEQVASDNLFLHLDCYHMQLLEGNLANTLRKCLPMLRHVQIAGVPGRHEPDFGEINYPYLFDMLDELGYPGWIGCEYRPRRDTLSGLAWARPYGIGA